MKMLVTAKYSKEGEPRTPDEKIVNNNGELYEFKERCNAIADFMGYDVEYFYNIADYEDYYKIRALEAYEAIPYQ